MPAIDFKSAFAKIVIDEREDWDRSQSVGASEVFGCHRRAYFAKREPGEAELPEEPEDEEFGWSERGKYIEEKYIVPKLKVLFGADKCFLMGDEQKTLYDGRLSSTADGMIIDQPRDVLANYDVPDLGKDLNEIAPEIKSFDPRVNLSQGAKPRHIGQNKVQLGLFHKATNYRPEWGILLYANASNLKDIRPFANKIDRDIYQRAKDRAEAVFDLALKAKDFKTEGKLTNECKNCPWARRCAEVDVERYTAKAVPTPSARLEEIKEKIVNVQKLRDEFHALEKVKKQAEADLKEDIFALETNKVGETGCSANLVKYNGKSSISKDLLIADGLEPEKYMTQGNPYFVLQTKVAKDKTD